VSYVMVMYNQVKQCKCTIGNMIHANYILQKEKSTLKDLSNDNCDDKMWNVVVFQWQSNWNYTPKQNG
jgi:regulator of replication initiation timing